MKRLFVVFSLVTLFAATSCSQTSQSSSPKSEGAVIEFETLEHNFGTIPYKGDGSFDFIFKNTGKTPLVLSNVRSSCGCTVPEWPKEPIKKGESGKIKVTYNTRITGSFSKSITVYSNAGEAPVVLIIKGKVEPAQETSSAEPANQ
jgi:hypothetical protein